MTGHRRQVGRLGEDLAADLAQRHGMRILARNRRVAGGEVDIVAEEGRRRVVIEVRTVTGGEDPLAAFGPAKALQVRRLATILGADRVDLMAVHLSEEAAELRWVRGAA